MVVTLKYYDDAQNEKTREDEYEIIRNVGVGKNETRMVKFQNGKIGFLKNSSKTTSSILDNLEYFISTLGKLVLNTDIAQIYKAFDGETFVGTISENVAKEDETLMMLSDIVKTLLEMNNPEVRNTANSINLIKQNNMKKFYKKDGTVVERAVVENEEDICQIIDMLPIALDLINVPSEQREEIKRNYFKMLVFDVLTNQVDRNNNNYGIVHNKKSGTTRFADLFDNSTIYIPGLPQTHYNLNGFLIDRKLFFTCLMDNYGEYVNDIVTPIVENKETLVERTERLSKRSLSEEEQQFFMPLFKKNIEMVCEITNEKHTSNKK